MEIAVLAFTERGLKLAESIDWKSCLGSTGCAGGSEKSCGLGGTDCSGGSYYSGDSGCSGVRIFVKSKLYKNDQRYLDMDISDFAGDCFESQKALVFIGAMGIAIRAIAGHVKDKLTDIPVIVMDEAGSFVIPVLSGHVGGGNELAKRIAKAAGAIPVITTATDVNNAFAVDVFAKRNGLRIANREGIARVSSKVLSGEPVVIKVPQDRLPKELPADIRVLGEPDVYAGLVLIPKEYCLGIGCKKGTEPEKLAGLLNEVLSENGIALEDIFRLASIDIKKNEAAITEIARENRLPFVTFSASELEKAEGDFNESDFVKETTGVGNVCERAAIMACGVEGGELVVRKIARDGMTIAVARRNWRLNFE